MEFTIYLVFTCMHARQYVNIRLGDFSSGTQLLRTTHIHSNTRQHGKQAVPVIVKQYLCSIEEICIELGGPKELQEVNDELFSNLIPTHLDITGEQVLPET